MTIYAVPITKAKRTMPVESNDFSDEVAQQIFAEGLKAFLNKNMSKIAVKDLEDDELAEAQEAAYEKASENLENLKAGNVKRRKAGKESREVMTEARRIAKEAIKAAYREAGKKITGVKSSVITAAANDMLADDPSFIETARKNVEAMKKREGVHIKATGALADLIAQAETAKPKVPPKRKEKATKETVVAAKGKAQPAQHARH